MTKRADQESPEINLSDEQLLESLASLGRSEAMLAARRRSHGSRGWIRREGNTYRQYYRVRDPAGKQKTKSIKIGSTTDYPTIAAARAAGVRAVAQLVPLQLPPGASPLWPRWVQRYLDVELPRTRPSTQTVERSAITKHLLPAFASLQLHEINAKAIQKFVDDQHASRREDGKRQYRPKTIRDRAGLVHRMLVAAKREGLAAIPTSMSDLRFPRDDRPLRTVADLAFTEPELERVLVRAVDPWLTMYRVCLLAGLRIGEALALRWENILWSEGAIDIRGSASRREVTTTKTARSAVRQAMPPELIVHLQGYRQAAWQENATGFMFAGADGQPLHSSGIGRHHLGPLLAELGIRRRTSHAFRHSFGMRLGRLPGISLARIAKAMRCSLRTAELYVSATDSDARFVIEAAAKAET